MDIIKTNFYHDFNFTKYFPKDNFVFLDIETTGLNRKKDMIYLIGFLYFDKHNESWNLDQFFADNIQDEKDLLVNTVKLLDSFEKLITFNGNSFDLPFIEERMKIWGIDYKINRKDSFDLYRIVRDNRDFLDLPNLKLKTIEEYLGYYRIDEYTGYECIQFYKDYLKSKNNLYKENILRHNYDDLFHMLDVMEILDVIEDNKTVTVEYEGRTLPFSLETLSISGDLFNFGFLTNSELDKNIKYYGHDYSLISEDFKYISFLIDHSIGYLGRKEKAYYIDLANYNFNIKFNDKGGYDLPDNLLLLRVNSRYYTKNILALFFCIFNEVFKK